jgi:hypothetical protein
MKLIKRKTKIKLVNRIAHDDFFGLPRLRLSPIGISFATVSGLIDREMTFIQTLAHTMYRSNTYRS